MSELINFALLISHKDKNALDRIILYCHADTRPDFPEDVPDSEEEWVDAYEILPYPNKINRLDVHTLILEFYDECKMGGNLPEEIATAVAMSQPEQILSYSDLEDHTLYERWQGQRYELIWDVDGLYEEKSTYLSEIEISKLVQLKESCEQVLLYLIKILK